MKRDAEALKQAACAAIDSRAEEFAAFGKDILHHPELGYCETRTSGLVLEAFRRLGLKELTRPAITGVKGWLRDPASVRGPRAAILGELDAVISPEHPLADPETGAAHACGHNAQLSCLLACAYGLSAVREDLGGNVCFAAVPAEEYVEIGRRMSLRKEGRLEYLGGKQQMIAEGAFGDIDLAMMVHSETDAPQPRAVVNGPAGGFIGKQVRFLGKEAHAGGAPWLGVNALNAASLAIQAIHANRETFRDEDHVRIHPILTKGGDLVNTVPADVRMESYVRAANIEAMRGANAKMDRAVLGACYAVGAKAEITTIPGYLPLAQNEVLSSLFAENARAYGLTVENGLPFCGSTDMGDLSWIMPVIQPTVSGFSGAAHSRDFTVCDDALAYLVPGKLLAETVIDLLCGDAELARKIISAFPRKTPEQYRAYWNDILSGGAER